MILRIDKYLTDMKLGTRTQVKSAIKKGLVKVDDKVIDNPGLKTDTQKNIVSYDGQIITYAEFEYYIMNKPAGILSATKDKNAKTVLDLVKSRRKDLFPVGRLDKDTEGLLLITNDGALAHDLLSPKKHVDKTYYVEVTGKLKPEHKELMAAGFKVDEELYALPANLDIIDGHRAYITIHEGKFHQIKRMMHAIGCEVIRLKRISMGSLKLPEDLKPGEYRNLTENELKGLKNR